MNCKSGRVERVELGFESSEVGRVELGYFAFNMEMKPGIGPMAFALKKKRRLNASDACVVSFLGCRAFGIAEVSKLQNVFWTF